jgi:RNA-directed DNA polymerase
MGKPAVTERPRLPSLSHSFTLDFVVLCNGTKAQAHEMKEELKGVLENMGLKLSEEKTKVTHITEGFQFLGYLVIREMGGRGKMAPKVLIPDSAIRRFRHTMRRILAPGTTSEATTAKIITMNRLTRGWCQYYRGTSSPSYAFGQVNSELWKLMTQWLVHDQATFWGMLRCISPSQP